MDCRRELGQTIQAAIFLCWLGEQSKVPNTQHKIGWYISCCVSKSASIYVLLQNHILFCLINIHIRCNKSFWNGSFLPTYHWQFSTFIQNILLLCFSAYELRSSFFLLIYMKISRSCLLLTRIIAFEWRVV